MDVAAVAASVKSAVETLGKLKEIAQAMRNAELKATIAQLANNLADAELKIADMKQEMLALREEGERLKAPPPTEKPTKIYGCYKFEGDPELYCPGCYSRGKKSPATRKNSRYWQCTVCRVELG